jgi:hypothetical protein
MRVHNGRSRWRGPFFDGNTVNDFIRRLERLAEHAPDANAQRTFKDLADQVAGLQLSYFLPHGFGRKLMQPDCGNGLCSENRMVCEFGGPISEGIIANGMAYEHCPSTHVCTF